MCRWIIFVGKNPLILEDLLMRPDHSIVDQVHIRFRPGLFQDLDAKDAEELKGFADFLFNVHGFGVTWYTDTLSEFDPQVTGLQPAQYRTIAPISTDLAFEQLCAHTASTCVLAHVRAASFPPVVEVNNHPFIYGDFTVMQNGGIVDFEEIRFDVMAKIHELQAIVRAHPSSVKSSVPNANYVFAIKGNTDTEHVATLVIAYVDLIRAAINSLNATIASTGPGAMLMALILAIDDIRKIQATAQVGPFNPDKDPRIGNFLNFCIAHSGTEMVVTRWRDSVEGQPLALYISLTAGEKLNRKYYPEPVIPPPDQDVNNEDVEIQSAEEMVEEYEKQPPSPQGLNVIVGSEPSTRHTKDWGLFGKNQCLLLDKDGDFQLQDLEELMEEDQVNGLRNFFTFFLEILAKAEKGHAPTGNIPSRLPTKGQKIHLGSAFDTRKGTKLNLHKRK